MVLEAVVGVPVANPIGCAEGVGRWRGWRVADVDAWYMEWLDNGQNFYRNKFYVATGDDGSPVVLDIQSASNAGVQQYGAGPVTFAANAPVDQQYPTVTQVAQLLFLCADASVVEIIIPAPQDSIFTADNFTVDPTAITTLIADVIAVVTNNLASPVASFLQGSLVNRRRDVP